MISHKYRVPCRRDIETMGKRTAGRGLTERILQYDERTS